MKRLLLLFLSLFFGTSMFTTYLIAEVTRVEITVLPTRHSEAHPEKYELSGEITSDSPGLVEYYWLYNEGSITDNQSMQFEEPGTQVVTSLLELHEEMKNRLGWIAIKILSPNEMMSNQIVYDPKLESNISTIEPNITLPSDMKKPIDSGSLQSKPKPAPPGLVKVWKHVAGFGESVSIDLACPKGKWPVNWGWDSVKNARLWVLIESTPLSYGIWRFTTIVNPLYAQAWPWQNKGDPKRHYAFNFWLFCDDCAEPKDAAPGPDTKIDADGMTYTTESKNK